MSLPEASAIATVQHDTGPRVPIVWIVILNYNGAQMTLNCVDSVLKIDHPNFRVIVVDNASTDDSAIRFKEALTDPRVELLVNDKNEGYAGGNNRGIERALAAGADYIFILNNDTIVEPGCLTPLVEAMERDAVLGIAGCPIFGPGPHPAINWRMRFNLFTGGDVELGDGAQVTKSHEVELVMGAAMLVRVSTIKRIGMFDERFFLFLEDADFCFRARRAGYKVGFVPSAGVRHLAGRTTRSFRPVGVFCWTRNRAWLVRRHGSMKHRIVFNLYSFIWWYPRRVLGRLVRRQFNLLFPTLRGIWQGHFAYPGPYPGDPEYSRCFLGARQDGHV